MTNANLDNQLSKLLIDKTQKHARRGRIRWSWLVVIVALVAAGFLGYTRVTAPIEVSTARVEQEAVASGKGPALVTASGYVVPRHKVEVSSKIEGRIKEALVKRGDRVKKGDILLKIEDNEFQARLLAAQAQVATLKARLAELRAGARPQEVAAADALVAAAEATMRDADLNLGRLNALRDKGAVSKQDLDRARTAHDVAQARLESDRKNAELVKIGPRREQIEAAEAQLREAEANVKLAKTELDYTVIRAPLDGVILEKLAEEGESVTNTNFGGTRGAKNSVISMADLSDLQVEVDVNETELAKVHPHQKTEIRLDSNPNHVYAGEVDEVSPAADRQKGTVQVKVRVVDPDASMKTEVSARVTFLGDPVSGAEASNRPRLWIPKSALVPGRRIPTVYIIVDGEAEVRTVKLGAEGEKGIEVTDGLDGSETLIVSSLDKMKEGARVAAAP